MPTNKKKSTSAKTGRNKSTTTSSSTAAPSEHDGTQAAMAVTKQDQRFDHILVTEPRIPNGGVISAVGLDNIKNHQYVAGDYTLLDTALNPIWTALVDFLPMTMAPNVVTSIGGMFCFISFVLSSYYNSFLSTDGEVSSTVDGNAESNVIPTWLYFWNGLALIIYYTLDCMDGKQARRTGSSSPLGQLFDHGIDGLCNLSHVQAIQCIVQLPPSLLLILQCSLQTAFFQAQWEEYYTGRLPHSTGKFCGVTEVTYGMAAWSLVTGIFGRDIYNTVVWRDIPQSIIDEYSLDEWLLGFGNSSLQIRHVAALAWITMIAVLLLASFQRTYKALDGNLTAFLGGLEKLVLGPYLLSVVAVVVNMNQPSAPSTLALGLAFCHLTIKIIVYSMAKMAYAAWQVDILAPYIGLSIWIRISGGSKDGSSGPDEPVDNTTWIRGLEVLTIFSLVMWIRTAIKQLCGKLEIDLFRIPPPSAASVSSGPKDLATAASGETAGSTFDEADSPVATSKKQK